MIFDFLVDSESRPFFERIIYAMILLYDIDCDSGCKLANEMWKNTDQRAGKLRVVEHAFVLDNIEPREWAERIGNPEPCTEGADKVRWQLREDQAKRRVMEFRKSKIHEWL
jgi:hypothetical protein